MKKIFISLAAIAALVSCVEEKGLEPQPQQPVGNQVTIKAVAAETKTALADDGTSVVWEENDEISVVVEGESDKYLETFTTSSTEKTSIAEFTAVLSNELSADETVTGIGYAVYPATSVTLAGNIVSIVHELPEEQTGTITNGMNLSYAKVDADDIKAGETNAVFYNALTLLKVNVPAGVKSVVLTSNIGSPALVGKVNFTVNKTSDISFAKGSEVVTRRSVTLSNGGAELEEGVHDLLVFPGTADELTLTMTGTDGAVYERTLNAVELVAGTYRTINLTEIFKMGVEDEMFISHAGGECEVKIASVADYTYNVEVTSTVGGDWLSYTLPTKGFHQDVITFSAEENTTGADRTANVTITWGEDQTRTFKMTQRAPFLDIVEDAEGNPIQWEEIIAVYATESDAEEQTAPKGTFNNIFTISLNEDPSSAYCYKIENLFANNNGGAIYYADYADNKLIVYVSEANAPSRTYYFENETVTLVYDPINKSFSSEIISAQTKFDFTGFANKDCYIRHAASVKEKSSDFILGTYLESFTSSSTFTAAPGKNLTIETSDDPLKGDVLITSFLGQTSLKLYGQRETKISVAGDPSVFLGNIGPCPAFTLTIADGVATFDESVIGYPAISDYSATGSATVLGIYLESFTSSSTFTAAPGKNLTIETSDDPLKGDVLITSFLGQTSLKLYGQLETKISVAGDPSVFLGNIGPCPAFTLTIADGVATFDESVIGYPTISDYSATKQ